MAEQYEIKDWVAFVKERTELSGITDVKVDDVSATAGGLSAQIIRLEVIASEGISHRVILKRTKPERVEMSNSLGIAREAEFFAHFAAVLDPESLFLPKTYYAAVEKDGYKVVIMEDLKERHGVQAGYFFGANSLLNWGKNLPELTAHFPKVTDQGVTIRAFELGAKLHGRFWQDTTLLEKPYLRAGFWFQGQGEESFNSTAQYAVNTWKQFRSQQEKEKTVEVSQKIVDLMENCIAKLSFVDYQAMWKSKPWTMVHGDFHPANFMVVDSEHGRDFDLIMLDWEAVGVGSGPQDLGQFMISHSSSAARKASEEEALAVYLKELNANLKARNIDEVTAEYVKQEYVEGGLCRWAWLFPVCASLCPAKGTQYFHDQMLEFMEEHNVEPSTMGMLRP